MPLWRVTLPPPVSNASSLPYLDPAGRFDSAVERLLELGDYEPAALLMRALAERRGAISKKALTERTLPERTLSEKASPERALPEGVVAAEGAGAGEQRAYLEYSAYLTRLGLPTLAKEYVALAAAAGAGGQGGTSAGTQIGHVGSTRPGSDDSF